MNDLKENNIIVTGATGGIGNSIIQKLYDAGANIYDMMKYKNVLLTQSSVKNLEKRLLNEKN